MKQPRDHPEFYPELPTRDNAVNRDQCNGSAEGTFLNSTPAKPRRHRNKSAGRGCPGTRGEETQKINKVSWAAVVPQNSSKDTQPAS